MWRRLLTMAIFSPALGGCATAGGGCPPLVAYSAATQRQAAAELRTLPGDSTLAVMTDDYGKLRKACRLYIRE
jgi:hypothetical protein